MKLVHRGLLLASLIGLGATTACAAPAPPAFETHTAKASTGVVYTTRASAATKAHLGVAHWHVIKVRGSKAIVLDGADDKGRVVFSSSIAAAADGKSWKIQDYARKGSATINHDMTASTGGTLDAKWGFYALSFARDTMDPNAVHAYGLGTQIGTGFGVIAAVVGAFFLPVAAAVAVVSTAVIGGALIIADDIYGGKFVEEVVVPAIQAVKEEIDKTAEALQILYGPQPADSMSNVGEGSPASNAAPDVPPDNGQTLPPDTKGSLDANPSLPDAPGATPGTDMPGAPPGTDMPGGTGTPSTDTPGSTGTDTAGSTATPGTDAPGSTGTPADAPGGSSTATDTTGGSTGGSGATDTGSGGGGGDVGGGGGGDTGGSYSAGLCRATACSKISKICICKHY
jgi:hypothetical protein